MKGVRFQELRDQGDPVECARRYDEEGADEITFLDVTATHEGRPAILSVVARTAEVTRTPLTVGGGVRSVDDVAALFDAGADKVSINSAAVADPSLIDRIAGRWGAQALVVAIDAKRGEAGGHWDVFTRSGQDRSTRDAVVWAREAEGRGAGELLLTSMDRDGTRAGYDLELLGAVADAVDIPIIASGGVGTLEHLCDGVRVGGASAVLAASIFHERIHTIGEARDALRAAGIAVRPPRLREARP